MAALCVLFLLSLQRQAAAAAWEPSSFCQCYDPCFAECRRHAPKLVCMFNRAKKCANSPDAAVHRGHGGERAAMCEIACAAISVCGAQPHNAADDEAACVRDCMK
ncbi:hypothetical protein BRADI_3g01710v3 [Brachypodium distachyon]|uniref:Bifunctional inhibitor/plant lipid transfer protein/seed storage helical domain-containing protein n=1 Tax=Brachypodium distachyon TaxID=15368 RepID=I1HWF7_BRADI|nr:hypothetical protein BRADI_3g01710v3 [Brachypodium distachyon]